jgi:hypothetical protein
MLPPGLTVRLVAALSIAAVYTPAAIAQTGGPYVLRSTLAGGGGISASGGYRVDATIGQPAAGLTSGGNAVVAGGFWGGVGAAAASTPTATVTGTVPSTPTATASPSPTQTATTVPTVPGATPTPSLTAIAATRTPSGSPTATGSRSPAATASPTPTPVACAGDCNQDSSVTVDELIKGVNIALGTTSVDACPSFDTNGDGVVTINELIAAVNRALNGCADTAAEG